MMHTAVFALSMAVQSTVAQPPRSRPVVRDSAAATPVNRRTPTRKPVTDALRASAFHDAEARELFGRARAARLRQDSTLESYDAKVRQRLSVKAAVGSIPIE